MHKCGFGLGLIVLCLFGSCQVLERASIHGLNSGFYSLDTGGNAESKVYAEVGNEQMDLYPSNNGLLSKIPMLKVNLQAGDTNNLRKWTLKKKGLDIDITTMLMKYRAPAFGLPAQLNTDLNLALYAGWRRDRFILTNTKNALGKNELKISNRGYDIGVFAGPGATLISPFTTRNLRTDEYNGLILQAGVAGFVESNVASFGLAMGWDYLLSPDRSIWIYNRRPWLGFVVGIALN